MKTSFIPMTARQITNIHPNHCSGYYKTHKRGWKRREISRGKYRIRTSAKKILHLRFSEYWKV